MSFFKDLFNKIKGVNAQNKTIKTYMFGTIVSGPYANWKTDPHPTILCLGCYNKNGKLYVHGIQMHEAGANLNYLVGTIINIKSNNIVTNPLLFYNYLKQNNPVLIKQCYRTYDASMCNFKIVSPGFTNISLNSCYNPDDSRDSFLNNINGIDAYKKPVNMEFLRNSITKVINSVKVWD